MSEQRRSKLSDARLKALHREPVQGKHTDGTVPGLYCECTVAGNLLWRLKYRLNGKENRAALGAYPDVGLAEARRRAQEARTLIAGGVAPVEHKRTERAAQEARAAQTFEAVARQWADLRAKNVEPRTHTKHLRTLERHAFPRVGAMPVGDLRWSHIAALVPAVNDRPATARLLVGLCRRVLAYAVAHELAERNAVVDAVGHRGTADVLPKAKPKHRAAFETPEALAGFLRALDAMPLRGSFLALRLLVLLPVRPVELCAMRWCDVDLDAGLWAFTMSKTDDAHTVPLPSQAVELLRQIPRESAWVFPNMTQRTRHMSRSTLLAAIRGPLGFSADECTAHGFRAVFRTMAHETLEADPFVLELALGHKMPERYGRAYSRVTLAQKRAEVAQRWADYLDGLKPAC